MFVHAARVIGGIGSPFFTKPSSGFRARKERKWTLHPGVFFFLLGCEKAKMKRVYTVFFLSLFLF